MLAAGWNLTGASVEVPCMWPLPVVWATYSVVAVFQEVSQKQVFY